MNRICIPIAMQLCFDDIGWDNGADLRLKGQASRTGIPRYHTLEDYEAVHLLGQGIGQKVLAPLCLADWDKDNLLRAQVGITHDPHGWNRAAEIDRKKFEEYAAVLNGSEYIELAIHGLLHGVYDENGKQLHEHEFFHYNAEQKRTLPLEKWDHDRRMEIFFKIYRSWGFTKPITSFIAPGGTAGADLEAITEMAERLKTLGIRTWTNKYCFPDPVRNVADIACVTSGGAWDNYASPPWNSYDFDPAVLGHFVSHDNRGGVATFSMHWPNVLRFNPALNRESIDRWIRYFRSEAEIFGTMLAKDLAFAANQLFYHHHTAVEESEDSCRFDVTEACARKTSHCPDTLYFSVKKGLRPSSAEGARITLYEEHTEFDTYRAEHDRPVFTVTF